MKGVMEGGAMESGATKGGAMEATDVCIVINDRVPDAPDELPLKQGGRALHRSQGQELTFSSFLFVTLPCLGLGLNRRQGIRA